MAFADHLDLATFSALADMDNGLARDAFQRDRVDPAVLGHLRDVRDAGSMARVEGTENRDVRLADAWNAFLEGREILWQRVLADGLSDMVLVHAISGRMGAEKDGADAASCMADAYAGLCAAMDRGDLVGTTFHPAVAPRPHFDDVRCGATGDRLRLVVEGWRPRLERFDRSAKETGYWTPVKAVPAPTVETVEIDLPTGVLIVADYIRAPGMHEGLEARIEAAIGDLRYDASHSVNSAKGRVATTRAIAEAANVLQVSTTNTVVSLHRAQGRLAVVDDHDEDGGEPVVEGMERVGRVSCDRWTVLMADRAAVLGLTGGDEAALDSWIAEEEALVVAVEPGRWRVSFGEVLSDPAVAQALGIGTTANAWLSMSHVADL